jgi:hypothetical protein
MGQMKLTFWQPGNNSWDVAGGNLKHAMEAQMSTLVKLSRLISHRPHQM